MKEIVVAFVHVFAMMAPWLVFGFLMAGIIAVWIPRSWVNRMMGPAMNAMSLTTVSALVGRKAAVAYLVTVLVGAILCGVTTRRL